MKHLQLRDISFTRYKNQFCVTPAVALNDPKYNYILTAIIAAGAWTITIKGFHPDGKFTEYTRNGSGNTYFASGNEISAQEVVSFTGITQICGFTISQNA